MEEAVSSFCSDPSATFHWVDYTLLVLMLVGTISIGVIYSCTGPKQVTSEEFLLGGSSMGTVPMALSLGAGFITAIELLGNPGEMYERGSQFCMIVVAFIFVAPITSYMYLPVFMKLRLTSAYEYLEMRFNKFTRVLAAVLYIVQMVLYTSVAVYAPALALSHVTGLSTYVAVTVVYLVCIVYSSQGGLKAVIMTDTFQAIVLVTSIIIVMAIGNNLLGGTSKVILANAESGRIELFNMNPSPTVRHSFWSVVIGGTFYWTSMYCSNQASIQKYLSVERIEQARSAIWTASFGLAGVFIMNFYTGGILYDYYQSCDPLQTKEITGADELLPLFVMRALGHLRGVPGLFVSGIFAASLGTVAAAISSLAAVTIKDVLSCAFSIQIPDSKGAVVSKWLSLFFGVLSFCLVFLVEQLGSVLQVAVSFNGLTGGVTLGLFSLGMFVPWANSKGAMTGGLTALFLVSWMGIGAQYATIKGIQLYHDGKPTSIEGCSCFNSTTSPTSPPNEVMWLYKVSYLWYTAIGALTTFFVGTITSLLTNSGNASKLDPDLLSPPVIHLLDSLPQTLRSALGLISEAKDQPVNTVSGHINLALSLDSETNQLKTCDTKVI